MQHQEPSPKKSSRLLSDSNKEAEDNLVKCLEALDKEGEAGLQRELERIHSGPLRGRSRVQSSLWPGMSATFDFDRLAEYRQTLKKK